MRNRASRKPAPQARTRKAKSGAGLRRRRGAEPRLQEICTEEAWKLLMENMQDFAICLFDTQGRIASWNAGAERILGWKAEDILGQPNTVFFPPEEIEAGRPRRELEVAAREGSADDENWLIRRSGERFWADGVTTALFDEQGKLRAYAKVFRDLTQRKRQEEEIRRLNEALESRVHERTADLEKSLRDMRNFSYTMAHDLRAPIRAMAGFAEALVEEFGPRLEDLGRDYAARIVEAARRMDNLIRDLLSYTRLSDTGPAVRETDLGQIVQAVLREASPEIRARGAEVSVVEPLGTALAHEFTLKLVVSNLLSNALKFVAPGVKPRVLIRSEQAGDRTRLWVEDNGIGIPADQTERIFGVFERLVREEDYPGTGIGLALVRKGVEQMGGSAGVESEPGKGSRFWVDLRITG